MPRDLPRLGSTVCSACHAAAALECHRHGSDLQPRKPGGCCSFPSSKFLLRIPHQTSDHPSNCTTAGASFHRPVQNDFRSRYCRGQQRRGRPGLYSASIVPNLRACCGSLRHKKFCCGAGDILGMNLPIYRYDGRPETAATVGRGCYGASHLSARMAYLRRPPRSSPRAPRKRSARRDARNHPAGRLRTLVGPRRIETDQKDPRNGGLILRNVL